MRLGFQYAWAGILLVCAIAVVLVVHEVRRSERTFTVIALATHRREQARERLTLARQELARAEREIGATLSGASSVAGAAAKSAPTGAKVGAVADTQKSTLSMRDGKIRPEVAEATDPVLRALHLEVFDARLEGVWGPLLLQLNLPPDKVAGFKALLRAHEERRLDVTAVAGDQQLELSDPAIQKMRNADGALLAQQMLELLGPDDGKIYQQFRRDLAVQAQIADLAAATYQTSAPLTYAESLELRTVLVAFSERMANGFVRPGAINWEAALAQIAGSSSFSATTVDGFRRQVADQQIHRQIAQRRKEIGIRIMGNVPSETWVPNFPALSPKPWTGAATIPKPH